jgi:hypothetical protein
MISWREAICWSSHKKNKLTSIEYIERITFQNKKHLLKMGLLVNFVKHLKKEFSSSLNSLVVNVAIRLCSWKFLNNFTPQNFNDQ